MTESILSIEGLDFPPYSQRGLVQTLTPIQQAKVFKRTVNGAAINLAGSQFRKYASTITNSEVEGTQVPAFDSIYIGQTVTVSCIQELSQALSTETEAETEDAFNRPAVEDSVRFEDGFAFYRPILEMMITDYNVSTNEWGAIISWSISLEEV
jgi:hypothetical protein